MRQVLPARDDRRCIAHKKSGDRCKKWALKGANVCREHGGAARQVRAAALARVTKQNATSLAEMIGIEHGFSADPVQAMEQALIIAQGYVVALEMADWRTKFEALDRVAAISNTMLRLKIDRGADGNREQAKELARVYLARIKSNLISMCTNACYSVASNGDVDIAVKELTAELEKLMADG
jgi:hypothetical protein